jgi:hypothetical protein
MKVLNSRIASVAAVALVVSAASDAAAPSRGQVFVDDIKNTVGDMVDVWTSPLRATGKDWLGAAGTVAVAVKSEPLQDGPWGCVGAYSASSVVRTFVLEQLLARTRPDSSHSIQTPPASYQFTKRPCRKRECDVGTGADRQCPAIVGACAQLSSYRSPSRRRLHSRAPRVPRTILPVTPSFKRFMTKA